VVVWAVALLVLLLLLPFEAEDAVAIDLTPVTAVLAPPNVNAWLGSVDWQVAISRALPLTVKHEPAEFSGWMARGPALPLKLKSCELVTAPPPSARPPQENSRTWFPAALLGSKLKQACVRVLTMSIELATLMCFPDVMISHPWPSVDPQVPT
jgi:hypothetical protein